MGERGALWCGWVIANFDKSERSADAKKIPGYSFASQLIHDRKKNDYKQTYTEEVWQNWHSSSRGSWKGLSGRRAVRVDCRATPFTVQDLFLKMIGHVGSSCGFETTYLASRGC